VTWAQGDFAAARALFEESLAISRELGNRIGIGDSLNNLGMVAHDQGDYPTARMLFEEDLAIGRELRDRSEIARSLNNLGNLANSQGDYPTARMLFEEDLEIGREQGNRRLIVFALEGLASAVAALGGTLRAARVWGAAERLREEIGSTLPPNERPRYDRRVAAARATLKDDAAFDHAWQEGRVLTLKQAIELALEKTVECSQ
jgi:non-specific serine/threonine protein kinase